jgi:prepilin-type N-terminal cleavage/methylation domain-containing protein
VLTTFLNTSIDVRKVFFELFFRRNKMEGRKGFTLVELMVVILIVGILAAVAIPIMRGRIDSAKWSEGRAMMGTVGTAIRAYCAEKDTAPSTGVFANWGIQLGFIGGDFDGTYFDSSNFTIESCTYDPNTSGLDFTIRGTNSALTPSQYELDSDGVWTWQ